MNTNPLRMLLYKMATEARAVNQELAGVEAAPSQGGGTMQALDKPATAAPAVKPEKTGQPAMGIMDRLRGVAPAVGPSKDETAKLARRKAIIASLQGNQANGGREAADFSNQGDLKDRLGKVTGELGGNPNAEGSPAYQGAYELGKEGSVAAYGFLVGYLQKTARGI